MLEKLSIHGFKSIERQTIALNSLNVLIGANGSGKSNFLGALSFFKASALEFEAWLFTAPKIVAEHFGNLELTKELQKAVSYAGEPELINHGKNTHPKARLQSLGTGYCETSDGPALIEKIGIPTIRNACPHFATWLSRLESLGSSI